MIQKLLNTQTKSIGLSSLILAGSYLGSALLGLWRDRLLAGKFGASNELDVYYAAFTIPDFIALILIFGAISAAIIPIFSRYLVKSEKEAWQYASSLLNALAAVLIAICAVFIFFAPLFVSLVAPGFSEEKQATTVLLMRIMFLSPLILGISNIVSGILHVFHRFFVTALAPLTYNAGIIAGIIFFVPRWGLPGLALGVVCGALLHLAIQLPAFFYSGFRYIPLKGNRERFGITHKGVAETLKLMVPRSLGLGAGQLNTIAVTAIASTLATGSIAVFNLANNLSSMVAHAISASLSTAIFPSMSLFYLKDKKEFERKFSKAFLQILFLIAPLSILLFILRAQVVRVVLGTGRFGWIDTRLTAACLGIFAISLFAQGLIIFLSKTFYAAHNTRIPALISFGTVAFNIAISLLFVWLLDTSAAFHAMVQSLLRLEGIRNISIAGLALAYSITVIAEAFLLLFFVSKKLKIVNAGNFSESLYKILLSGCVMTVAAFLVRQLVVQFQIVSLQTFLGVFSQLVLSAIAGLTAYIISAFLLQSPELEEVKKIIGTSAKK